MSEKNWVPVLAPLLSVVFEEKNADAVLKDLMAVGLNFDVPSGLKEWKLVGFYQQDTMRQAGEKAIKAQWDMARAVALRLESQRSYQMSEVLRANGWKFEGERFIPLESAQTDEYAFFPAGAVHDAYVHIRSIFKGAEREILVVDSYVDGSLLDLLTSTNGLHLCRVLTGEGRLSREFTREADLFQQQHGLAMEVRTSRDFHDRHVILDGQEVYLLGASIKDAGKRAFNIVPVQTDSIRAAILSYAETTWNTADVLR